MESPSNLDLNVVLTILRHLSRSEYRTIDDVERQLAANGIELTRRSVQRYLKAIADTPAFGVECRRGARPYGYRLGRPATDLTAIPLSPTDALLLRLTYESIGAMLPKAALRSSDVLLTAAKDSFHETFERAVDREKRRRILVLDDSLARIAPLCLREVLEQTAEALHRDAKMEVRCRLPGGEEMTRVVSPLGLVRHDVSFTLFCADETRCVFPLALHRIAAARVLPEPAERPAGFRLADAARGLRRPQDKSELVRLTFDFTDDAAAESLAESPFNRGQKILRNDKGGYTLTVILPDSPRIHAWLALWKETAGITKVLIETLRPAREAEKAGAAERTKKTPCSSSGAEYVNRLIRNTAALR